jgi:hypothetical protein
VIDRVPPPARPWVFAVEDTAVQITWAGSGRGRGPCFGPGPLRFRCADTVVDIHADGGPGAVVLDNLPPSTRLVVAIDGDSIAADTPRAWRRQPVTTLASPPGAELFRFATLSDLHVGAIDFGFRSTMVERPVPDEAHPVRATRTAISELTSWGAQLLVIKGDLTHKGRSKDWDAVGRLLAEARIPVEIVLGNHDWYGAPGEPDPYEALASYGYDTTKPVRRLDVPGLALVLVDSTTRGTEHLQIGLQPLHDEIVDTVGGPGVPAFIALHHYFQRLPIPAMWPPGIPSYDAKLLLSRLAAAHPATMISSGHTHRHRRRFVGPLVLTEVGSPKDFPGTWAGYVVHEGGIRQVVRRVAAPDVLGWTDYSARAVGHAWGKWSPGLRGHRCFTHRWPS